MFDTIRIRLAPSVRKQLERIVRRGSSEHRMVVRARCILLAAKGLGTAAIAREVGMSARCVRKWKRRFADDPRLRSLNDATRSGRPARITVPLRCELIRLACERPQDVEKPAAFRDVWTQESLAKAFQSTTKVSISKSEVGRILRFEKLRPHRVRQWLKCSDPEFAPKAKRICGLYLRPPKDGVVVCVDEKPLQALARIHATTVDRRDGSLRREYEYKRHGTQTLLGAFEVGTGRVFGRVVAHRSADALVAFMEALARRYPTGKVYVVWDNLNTHYDGKDKRWTRFNERHGERFVFVYTPKHASWLNQIEIWFSLLHRRLLRYGSFSSLEDQARRIRGFIGHWNRWERHPFRWTWRSDRVQNRRAA